MQEKSLAAKVLDETRARLDRNLNKEIPNTIITIETAEDPLIYKRINEQ